MCAPKWQHQIERKLKSFRRDQLHCEDAPLTVRLATEYIRNRLFDPDLTVMQLRESLGITDAMFSTRFRHYHGRNPASYIRHLRVEAAKRLLHHVDEPRITDVALQVGYEHYRTFTRVFKRITGRSPQAFREEIDTV